MPSCEQMGTTQDKVSEFWTLVKTCKGKRYEDDSERWDRLLRLLGIPLREQGILSRMIGEGRFAKANNPQSYLAMATRTQAKTLNLYSDDPAKCEQRGAVKGAEVGRVSDMNLSRFENTEGYQGECPHDAFIELAVYQVEKEDIEEPSIYERVPDWLTSLEQNEHGEYLWLIDWDKVAELAVVKQSMREVVAFALRTQAGLGFKRDRAAEVAKGSFSKQEIEAAYKWIKRNWDSRIVPIFKMKHPPKEKAILPGKLTPAQALGIAIDKERDANKPIHWH